MISIISAILFRLGGCGKDDGFLPFLNPHTPIANKWWRWIIGIPISILTGNYIYIITYFCATSIFVYGESSWTNKLFGPFRWFVSGVAFGLASLSWGNGLWCGSLFIIMKFLNIDQAWFEIMAGGFGTLILLWR